MLGERLIKLRKAKQWTQTDLAELCGVSRNSIVNWETGKREPKIGDIQRLAEIFNVSPNDLIGNENSLASIQSYADTEEALGTEGFAYWGGVVDKARKVVERGDMQEINLITPLLKSALNMLLSVSEHITTDTKAVISGVSAYNGDNSNYTGNTLNLAKAIA